MEIIIREMEEPDFADVTSLWQNELGFSHVTSESIAATYAKMRQNDCYKTFVAIEDDGTGDSAAVIGFITTVEVMAVGYPVGYMKINGLAVKKEYRGMGIGRKLIEHIEQIAKENGISRIGLATGFQRKEAHAFYERLGYKSGSYWYGKNLK